MEESEDLRGNGNATASADMSVTGDKARRGSFTALDVTTGMNDASSTTAVPNGTGASSIEGLTGGGAGDAAGGIGDTGVPDGMIGTDSARDTRATVAATGMTRVGG